MIPVSRRRSALWLIILVGSLLAGLVHWWLPFGGLVAVWNVAFTGIAGASLVLAAGYREQLFQRRAIEEPSQLSERELRLFQITLDQTLDCVFMFDVEELLFSYANEGALKQLGYSIGELSLMHPWDIKPEFSERAFRDLTAPLLTGEQSALIFETVHQNKQGDHIPVEVLLQHVIPPGESARFVAIVRDITERKQAQHELTRLSSVARETTNSVIITDVAGYITWVNRGFCRLTGYGLDEVLGQIPGRLLQGPETDSRTVLEMHNALKKGEGFNVDVVNYHTDKTPYWVRIVCSPMRDENGDVCGYIAIQSDIDDEKKAEKLVKERSERTTQQRNLIAELSTDNSLANSPIDDQLANTVTKLSEHLQTDRISIWMMTDNNTQLQRRVSHRAEHGLESPTMAFNAADYPDYFAAIGTENQIVADDAHHDPRTRALAGRYFGQLEVHSVLHTAIQQEGCLIGVLWVEQDGAMRQWQDDEKTFLTTIAGLCAQMCANAERKQAQTLADGAAELQNVTLNTVVDGIVTADQYGIIQTFNPALERMFGYTKDELRGQNIKKLMPEDYANAHDGFMRNYTQQLVSSTIMGDARNLTARRQDGSSFPVEITVQETRHFDEVLYVASVRDVSKLQAQQEKIETLAYYDSLTELPNRRLLEKRIEELNGNGQKRIAGNALLFIDIDDFKNINDALGHRTGDILLKEAGRRINACISPDTDIVARLGGDEFCVVLTGLEETEEGANEQAERIARQIIQELRAPFLVDGDHSMVSASAGISVECCAEIDLHVRMKRADIAMYQAKKFGKNQACLFNARMETQLLWRIKIQADLKTAIDQGALTVHYQPIVDDSGCIVKLEALSRWQHPTDGWIGPDVFIPIAEASHLIVPLGSQILSTVLNDMENWLQATPDLQCTVAVNISQFQLAYPRFQAHVEQLLSGLDFSPGRLVFEVTESALAEDIQASVCQMQALAALGISFSLDDFGTGYSSLNYLKRLPIKELKIDKSFVDGIPEDRNDIAIIKSVCSLATAMELEVVAEGVETNEQFQYLKNLKCDRYQGYYFSKPRSAKDIEHLLSRGSLLPIIDPT